MSQVFSRLLMFRVGRSPKQSLATDLPWTSKVLRILGTFFGHKFLFSFLCFGVPPKVWLKYRTYRAAFPPKKFRNSKLEQRKCCWCRLGKTRAIYCSSVLRQWNVLWFSKKGAWLERDSRAYHKTQNRRPESPFGAEFVSLPLSTAGEWKNGNWPKGAAFSPKNPRETWKKASFPPFKRIPDFAGSKAAA